MGARGAERGHRGTEITSVYRSTGNDGKARSMWVDGRRVGQTRRTETNANANAESHAGDGKTRKAVSGNIVHEKKREVELSRTTCPERREEREEQRQNSKRKNTSHDDTFAAATLRVVLARAGLLFSHFHGVRWYRRRRGKWRGLGVGIMRERRRRRWRRGA